MRDMSAKSIKINGQCLKNAFYAQLEEMRNEKNAQVQIDRYKVVINISDEEKVVKESSTLK